ncbi:MAG: hypothetical protein ACREQO_12355 [Candidatus Binatia bacterium]
MGYKYEPNSLFRAGSRPKLNACVGTNGGPYNFGAYGEGFFEGGFQIINAIKRGEWTIDILIYPAAFSFRHGIELYLKHMVHLFDEIANSGAYTTTHSLQDNWSVFDRQAIASKIGSFDPLELSIAKDIIDDFCNIDPTGQVFRYPEDIKGNKHLIGLGVINVEVLEDGMRVLHELFEGWRLALEVMRTSRP